MRPTLRLNNPFTSHPRGPCCYVKVVFNGLESIKMLPGQVQNHGIRVRPLTADLVTPAGTFNRRWPRCHPAYVSAVMFPPEWLARLGVSFDWTPGVSSALLVKPHPGEARGASRNPRHASGVEAETLGEGYLARRTFFPNRTTSQ